MTPEIIYIAIGTVGLLLLAWRWLRQGRVYGNDKHTPEIQSKWYVCSNSTCRIRYSSHETFGSKCPACGSSGLRV